MIIIGLDPGSLFTGFGVIEYDGRNVKYIDHGVIKNSSGVDFAIRLHKIGEELSRVFAKYKPAHVVVEKIFLGKNVDSAFKLGHVRGVAFYEAHKIKAQVKEYAAREVKKGITGYGAAEKEQVRFLVLNYLKLKENIQIDAADALALAIYHSQRADIEEKLSRNMKNIEL
ncbi:MAG: crossover junction endodeoxyribonuclease RuvC [Bdellovibrionota bacterium]